MDRDRRTEEPADREAGAAPARPTVHDPDASGVEGELLQLQATGGNQMVVRLLDAARGGPDAGDEDLRERIASRLGQGESLPREVQAQAQADLGQPVGGVRVHRDSGAASLADELGARAFTTGRDIFFGEGAYDPSSTSGYTVLAHELAHTAQQSAGQAATPVAPGVAVSTPGDRDEQAADQLAHRAVARRIDRDNAGGAAAGAPVGATPAGTGAGAGGQLPVQRVTQVLPGAAEPIVLQRYEEHAAVPAMGSSSGDSDVNIGPAWGQVLMLAPGTGIRDEVFLPFNDALETVPLNENVTTGTIEFHVFESVTINNMLIDDHQWGSWRTTVPYTVGQDQTVTYGGPIVVADSHGSGATASLTAGGGTLPGGGYLTLMLTIASSGSQSLGGGVGVGPISASSPASGSSNFAGGLVRTFTVNLRPAVPQPVAGPDVSFQPDSPALEDGQEGQISQWFQALPQPVQDGIRNGRRGVSVSGYASTTGRRHHDRDLSEQRAHVVEHILRGFAGSAANINVFFFGKDQTPGPDSVEEQQYRRATIVVQVPNHSGPGTPGP